MKLLSSSAFDSRVKTDEISKRERWLGYFFGPIGVTLMNGILGSYLNVYYTDVLGIAAIWGGLFLSLFPIVCKTLDSVTYIIMGRVIDRTKSPQGKARPWILLSAPVLLVSMIMLFAVPDGSDNLRAVWIFASYNLFYSIGYTAYSTSHTLLVPLSTENSAQRGKLSVFSSAQNMVSGTFLAILFPCWLVPMMGINRGRWLTTIIMVAGLCCPLLLMEYFFTKERVTGTEKAADTPLLREQFRCCLRSRTWVLIMLYVIVNQLFQSFYSTSVFYYCNWVLGSYNDGYTQALFYGLGNAPLGLGVFLCGPLCAKLGRKRAMIGGYLVAACGALFCLLNARSLPLVLLGQAIKAVGTIPASFMTSALLADALDDVQRVSGKRCDGFSSSVYNIIVTISGGIALFGFNLCLSRLGYLAPSVSTIPVQNPAIQAMFILGALGSGLVSSILLAGILALLPKRTD